MRKVNKTLVISALLLSLNLFSQNKEVENPGAADAASGELLVDAGNVVPFIELYSIDVRKIKEAKILEDVLLRREPYAFSDKYDLLIPQGTIIEIYNYFPKDAAWAVKFGLYWGFLSADVVLPIKDKSPLSKSTSYDEPPRILSQLQPTAPVTVKKEAGSREVIIEVLVGKTGAVLKAEIVKSYPGLDAAAIEAVKNLKFKPAKLQGTPVEAWMVIPVKFEGK